MSTLHSVPLLQFLPPPSQPPSPKCYCNGINHDRIVQGGERYQQSFYVFEELAQAPATSSVRSLVAQAVAELHLGRLEEAESALGQAVRTDPKCADAIANLLVLNAIAGKDVEKITGYVY
jgi:hypothetical protein